MQATSELLTPETIDGIKNVITISMKLQLSAVGFLDGYISGVNLERSVVLYNKQLNEFPFTTLYTNRIKQLQNRIDMVECAKIQMSMSSSKQVSSLLLYNNKMKVSFRCASHLTVPKYINDSFENVSICWNDDDINMLKKGLATMGKEVKDITFKTEGKCLVATLKDMSNDEMVLKLTSEMFHDKPSPLVNSYDAKSLLLVLEHLDDDKTMKIGEHGVLKFSTVSSDVFVIRKLGI